MIGAVVFSCSAPPFTGPGCAARSLLAALLAQSGQVPSGQQELLQGGQPVPIFQSWNSSKAPFWAHSGHFARTRGKKPHLLGTQWPFLQVRGLRALDFGQFVAVLCAAGGCLSFLASLCPFFDLNSRPPSDVCPNQDISSAFLGRSPIQILNTLQAPEQQALYRHHFTP